MTKKTVLTALIAGLSLSSAAIAQFTETEPNDSKATANLVTGINAGGTITGTSTSAAGVGIDTYRVQTGTLPLAIYRHRLTITTNGTAGHTGSIRGLSQSAGVINPASDVALQTTSTTTTPPRTNQWYGFGRQEEMYYRVTGATATTAPYTATMATDLVTPGFAGSFNPGSITITTMNQGHTTDTDMWVYDSAFNAIPGYGNDDNSILGGGTGVGFESHLVRNYAPGTYYLAISNFGIANNQPAAPDDDFLSGSVTDFPNIILNTSTSANLNVTFTISDGVNSIQTAATKIAAFDMLFFEFTVVPAPGAAALLGLGGLVAARRRRA